jgi:glucose/arabinose dehydrogenase
VVVDGLPEETHHGWKYIAFGPDGKLYVPVGAPCNICNPDPPFATILRMNPDGTEREVVARGVRNSVGFDWHPETEALWFTDNGRDWMGDDRPPCELNRVSEPGQHFGYPFVHGADLLDPEFGSGKDPADYTAPVQELGPHVAPLGMEFYTGAMFPEAYRGQVLIAEHGSWNRSDKIGYRVTLVRLDETREAAAYEPFARGWLQGESNWGRPVDLEQLPDGSLLVSDDQTGAIYRISYAR